MAIRVNVHMSKIMHMPNKSRHTYACYVYMPIVEPWQPIVEYSSLVWNPVDNNQLTKQIESAQGKAAQWITNNWNYDISSGQIAKELQLQSLLEWQELARLKLLHSIYWGQKFLPKCIIPERTWHIHGHTF